MVSVMFFSLYTKYSCIWYTYIILSVCALQYSILYTFVLWDCGAELYVMFIARVKQKAHRKLST